MRMRSFLRMYDFGVKEQFERIHGSLFHQYFKNTLEDISSVFLR